MIPTGSGKLYIGTVEGEILGELKGIAEVVPDTEWDEAILGSSIKVNEPMQGTITCKIDRLSILSLMYGRKVTNNWLRMHGGIMRRKVKR